MDNLAAFILITLLVALLIDGLVIWIWRRQRAGGGPPFRRLRAFWGAPTETPPSSEASAAPPFHGMWPELLALGVVLGLGLYLAIFAPRTPLVGPAEPIAGPFAFMGPLRRLILDNLTQIAIGLPIALVAAWIALFSTGTIHAERPRRLGLALLAALCALEAEVGLLANREGLAIGLYAASATLLVIWWFAFRRRDPLPIWDEGAMPRRLELGGLSLILLLTAVLRFYQVGDIPYGIEGDEAKWTTEVASLMVDSTQTLSADYHYTSVPVSFYMQAPFQRLLGPSILAGRVAVAFYSVVASLAFFFLARLLSGPRLALLATLLLATSPVDISASRLANVESHVKLWSVLPLAVMVMAIRWRRSALFLLAGIGVGFALLTYDTLAVMLPISLAVLAFAILTERWPAREWGKYLAVFLIPVGLALPKSFAYWSSRWGYYGIESRGWSTSPLTVLGNGISGVLTNLFRQATPDFLFNRQGPFLPGELAPFLVLGLVLAALSFRRRGPAVFLIWFLLVFLTTPVAFSTPMVRVVYPGFPALHALAAFGVIFLFEELRTGLAPRLRPALLGLSGLLLLGISANGVYIYFNQVADPRDRVLRREATDLILTQVVSNQVVLTPYIASIGDVFEDEQPLTQLVLRQRLGQTAIDRMYVPLPFDRLLHEASSLAERGQTFVVIYDKASPERRPERERFLNGILVCLTPSTVSTGQDFDVYHFGRSSLAGLRCVTPAFSATVAQSAWSAGDPVTIEWASDHSPAEVRVACNAPVEGVIPVEGEAFAKLEGWMIDSRFVAGFSGSGYLEDTLISQDAATSLRIPEAGEYRLWVRSMRRREDLWPGILTAGGQPFEFSTSGAVPLNEWVWENLGLLDLPAGQVDLRLTRPYQGDPEEFYALFVDRVVLARSEGFDPSRDEQWSTAYDQTFTAGGSSQGALRLDLQPGTYECSLQAIDGAFLVDNYGQTGVWSDPITFTVEP